MIEWGLYKPVLTALALPPVPFLILVLIGARAIASRRVSGHAALWLGVVGLWLSACQGTAIFLQDVILQPPAPFVAGKQGGASGDGSGDGSGKDAQAQVAIVVLGGGRDALAREYALPDLTHTSAERLRYGIWLSRQTGWPLGFSGGVGWAQMGGKGAAISEAAVAARIARDQYGWPLRWTEEESADTRGNARQTVAMLARQGVREIVLVTDAFHMRRARGVFEAAAQDEKARSPGGVAMSIKPAPLAYWQQSERPVLDWLPSGAGMMSVHVALRECLGLLVGA